MQGNLSPSQINTPNMADSEQTASELQFRHAQKLESLGRLASGIAHEINTPIQFIGDNLNFLSQSFETIEEMLGLYRQSVESAELRQAEETLDIEFLTSEMPTAINQALDGVRRLSVIVRAMKAFGHPDRSEQESVDINDALETTIIVAKSEFKYVADLVTDFGDIPFVRCFKGDLTQVFLNLVVNAAHAIAEKNAGSSRGEITIRTSHDDDDVVISIADNGSGIPEAVQGKIFDAFFTTKSEGKGTGQGLALAKDIVVNRHGGSLTFDTEMGVGTTFTIRIPVKGLTSDHEEEAS